MTKIRPRPIKVTRDMHDRCLRACQQHKARLTRQEVQTLNLVANNWAASFPTSKKFVTDAAAILMRIGV